MGAQGERSRCPDRGAGEGGSRMGKVMVVDDAVADLRLIEGILKSAGHRVVCCDRGDRLEDRLADERPDLLLLDIVMPDRNGYDVLRGLKKDPRTKDTPVVFVSSKNQESDRVWGKRQGAADYLGKPFTSEDLLTVVRRLVG
jgi:CheY-like chemotaxis protein